MSIKYKLVPTDVLEQTLESSTRTLIALDKDMKRVLNDKKLADDKKYIKYMSIFLEYLKQREKGRSRPSSVNVTAPVKNLTQSQQLESLNEKPAESVPQRRQARKVERTPASLRSRAPSSHKKRSPYQLRERIYNYEL